MQDDRTIPDTGATPETFEAWRAAARTRRAEDFAETDRLRTAVWVRGLIEIMVVEWIAVGIMLWSFHTGSATAGQRAFWGALLLGNGGFLVLLFRTWKRAERIAPWR